MGKLHYLTALLLIILLAVVSGWVFESIDKKPIIPTDKLRHDPDYFLKGFTATTMDKAGKPAYQIKANHLEHYPDDGSMKLELPFITFYENNIKAWTAQANKAVILKDNEKIHLTGDVVLKQIVSTKKIPMTFTAAQLTIEPNQNIAHSTSSVKLIQGTNIIQAIGMRADMNKNKIEFLSKTRSHYVLPTK